MIREKNTIFKKRLLDKFVANQEQDLLEKRWGNYQNYLKKINFIKDVNEEKYQDGFFSDIFENCLGYVKDTTNPNSYNLLREEKNENDSKKADGVIYIDGRIIGVIELKGNKQLQLDNVEHQAFWYLTQHSNARYVIISNFDELRFYIDKSTAYQRFNLFNLTRKDFDRLHLILSYESIRDSVPLKLKEKSSTFEQDISKELYQDFSNFRENLFNNLIKNNNLDKSILLRLTQKLCDRIIFILFAEDRGLLKLKTINEIIKEFKNQKFTSFSLYEIYKFYFRAINSGDDKLEIPKYNGGLFATDDLLDSLIIDNKILDDEVQNLSNYDFDSDISVNILGHIFEQSLTDLEEINASINNIDFDKNESKRKKDGVFYTPEYITIYIVENTLGKLCKTKKEELAIIEVIKPKNSKKPTKKEQKTKDNLEIYRDWLFNLKILDPACGSGAFLNQALEFLIKEHQSLQENLVIMGDITAYYEIEKSILENNLYGVDINEDAVEIAKLSLWLRTATKGRELTKLADKILCANSLLNMPFKEGSFDIVIGNPPYVRQEMIKDFKPALKERYKIFVGTADLFIYFYELGINMLKSGGVKGFICSNKFFRAKYGQKLREMILSETTIKTIIDFNGVKVFADATVDSAITILQKDFKEESVFKYCNSNFKDCFEMAQSDLTKDSFSFISPLELNLKKKIESIGRPLKEWDINIYRGILTGLNEAFIIDRAKRDELIKADSKNKEIIKPLLRGKDIKKYSYKFYDMWLINTHNNPPIHINNYPILKEHLDQYYDKLEKRTDKGLTPYNLRNCAYLKEFENEKIL
jgi:type I restriction-modification system DNA methylase subunit